MGMMINRRRACGGENLPYDAEIEYLESTGTQLIDTMVIPTRETHTVIYKRYTRLNNNNAGDGLYTNSERFHDGFWSSKFHFGIGGQGNYTQTIAWDSNWHTIELYGSGKAKIDDTEFVISGGKDRYSTNFGLFGRLGIAQYAFEEIQYCQIYQDDILVRNLIPVRVGQVGYMYDKVSKQLFGNAGTGSFILGPDK